MSVRLLAASDRGEQLVIFLDCDSKVQVAVDMLSHLLALHVTLADVGDRTVVSCLCADIQDATGEKVRFAHVSQGYNGKSATNTIKAEGIALHVFKPPGDKRVFVLLPRRWALEGSFAWTTRSFRLVKDYDRYASTLTGFHLIAIVGYRLKQATEPIKRVYTFYDIVIVTKDPL